MKIKFLYFILLFLFTACGFAGKKNLQKTAYLYQQKIAKANADYQIFHHTNTQSTLYCNIKSDELLPVFLAHEKQNKIKYAISGKLFSAQDESIVIDSFALQRDLLDTVKWIREAFIFSANLHENYILKITLKDLNKSTAISKTIYFEKELDSKENFQIFKSENRQYSNIFNTGDSLFIYHNSGKKNLSVRYFNNDFSVASAPFNLGELKVEKINPKATFTLTIDSNFFILPVNQKGIYQIITNETDEKGLNILAFENDFPTITTASDMIAPLQYISTKEEMQEISLAKNKKIVADQFWLRKAKNDKQIAKKLIKTYYKRVENANRFFTSYKAGWKTDRGMIMIIFGAPNIIYQSKEGESWIYGEKNNMYALNFTFTKIKNKFSDNDFQLNRSAYFKNIWNTAQTAWRDGHPYSDMDIKERIYEQERRQKQNQFYIWY
ncbi:MAG: GWxTD domain-containing protein [Bacteroidota bacterium]|nr:GWxTD domain-containing protein [Bacteroidota bacterium]